MQPRWVQMPITTSHCSWPDLTRASSDCGSGRLATLTARASSICFLVRWLISTSIGAPAAMVDASGFIWEMKGQSAAAPPTATAAPVATNKKSRRVGWSAEDAVVTIPTLSSYAAGGTAPGAPKVPRTACRRPRPPAAAELHVPPPKQGENSSPESFYWHPCRASASPLSARERAMNEFRGQRCFIETFPARTEPGTAHADSAFPTRHPPEHRHDSQALRLSGRGRPYHRTGGLPRLRPAFPPGGNGLPRSGQHRQARLLVEIRAMAHGARRPPAAVHHQRNDRLPRFPLPDGGHPAIRARERRRHRGR